MKSFLLYLIFGERAQGELIPQPTFRSSYPENRPSENQWAKEFKVGSRYGHRGSFYQTR